MSLVVRVTGCLYNVWAAHKKAQAQFPGSVLSAPRLVSGQYTWEFTVTHKE